VSNFIGFPNISAPFVDQQGRITLSWLRFLQAIFQRSGGTTGSISDAPAVVVTPTGSPFTFTATATGSLLVSGGGVSKMTFTRDGVNFYKVGHFYCAHPVDTNDSLIITYPYGAPTMVFIPT
jgi:hypothetical protein